MTPGPCFDPREAATVAELPEPHPLRVHARECPRCRALLDAYRAFTEADAGAVTPRELADADARLGRALGSAIGTPTAAGTTPATERPSARAARRDPSFWERLLHPAMRPAVGFAAIAIVLGAILLLPRLAPRSHEITLRGDAHVTALELARAERSADALHLSWNAVTGADGYELRFYSGELNELGHVGPLTATTADLLLAGLPFPAAAGDTLLVRVAAMAGGDAIATSETRLIEPR